MGDAIMRGLAIWRDQLVLSIIVIPVIVGIGILLIWLRSRKPMDDL